MTKTGTSKNSLLRKNTSRNNLKKWRDKKNQKMQDEFDKITKENERLKKKLDMIENDIEIEFYTKKSDDKGRKSIAGVWVDFIAHLVILFISCNVINNIIKICIKTLFGGSLKDYVEEELNSEKLFFSPQTMSRGIIAKYLASKKVICEILENSENLHIGFDGGNNLNRSIKEFHISGYHKDQDRWFTFTISLFESAESSGKILAKEIQRSIYSFHNIQDKNKFKRIYLNSLTGIIMDNCSENTGKWTGVVVELEKLRKKEYDSQFKTQTSIYVKLIDIGCIDHICNLFIKEYSSNISKKYLSNVHSNKILKSLYLIKNLCTILNEDPTFHTEFYQMYKKKAPIPPINEIRFNSYLTGAEFILEYWSFIDLKICLYKYQRKTSEPLEFIYQYFKDPSVIFELTMFSKVSNLITRPLMRELNQSGSVAEYFKILNTFINDKINELEKLIKDLPIFKDNVNFQELFQAYITLIISSIQSKLQQFALKKDYLNNSTLLDLDEVKFISFSNRMAERKQGSIKRYLLKHKDMKLIVLESLIGLQQVNELFNFNDLSLLKQQEYLQEARVLYDNSDTRFDRMEAKSKVFEKKMKANTTKKLKEENEKPVLEFLQKNKLLINVKDINKPVKTLTIKIMQDSLKEMISKKMFVPKGYSLPKTSQKKDFYLQEIKKVMPK